MGKFQYWCALWLFISTYASGRQRDDCTDIKGHDFCNAVQRMGFCSLQKDMFMDKCKRSCGMCKNETFINDDLYNELQHLQTAWFEEENEEMPDMDVLQSTTLDQVMKIKFGSPDLKLDKDILSIGTKDSSRTRDQRNELSQYECIDALGHRTCSYFRQLGACNTRRRSMKQYCAKSCRFCEPPNCKYSKFGCCLDGQTMAAGPHLRGCDGDCVDIKGPRYCKVVKRMGLCFHHKGTYLQKCTKSCGFCRACEDDEPMECRYASRYGGCQYRKGEMMNTCRKSCNYCGASDPCYHHVCPKLSVCTVSQKGFPMCVCKRKCHKGDRYTGLICGRNGIQYDNLCHLKRSHCHDGKKVTIKNYGKCYDEKDKRSNVAAAPALNRSNQQPIKPDCRFTKFGCCLDGETECRGEGYEGCPRFPVCRDLFVVVCRRFSPLCGTKKFMKRHCPKACFICK